MYKYRDCLTCKHYLVSHVGLPCVNCNGMNKHEKVDGYMK
jgi:hypothetical protein